MQFEHGVLLLHRTFLRRHVTQLRKLVGSCVDCKPALGLTPLELPERLLGCRDTPALLVAEEAACMGGTFKEDKEDLVGENMAGFPPFGTFFSQDSIQEQETQVGAHCRRDIKPGERKKNSVVVYQIGSRDRGHRVIAGARTAGCDWLAGVYKSLTQRDLLHIFRVILFYFPWIALIAAYLVAKYCKVGCGYAKVCAWRRWCRYCSLLLYV